MADRSADADRLGRSLQADFQRRAEGTPLYLHVKQTVERQILSGRLRTGDILPAEPELCRLFAVSSITARRALLELAQEGLVRRRPGVGTVVISETKKIAFALVFIGFNDTNWTDYGNVIGGVGEAAWQAGADFSVLRLPDSDDAIPILKDLVESGKFGGLLLRPERDIDESVLDLLELRGIPYVVVKRHLEGRRINFVTSHDADGAFRAVAHLTGLGHRRVGLVTGPPDISPRREVLRGYRVALGAAGIAFDDELVQVAAAGSSPESRGYAAMRELLAAERRPSAVCVYGDSWVAAAVDAIRDAGLTIPDDIALIGYGSITQSTALIFRPRLTTVETSYAQIGRESADALFELIAKPDTAPHESFVRPPLVVRGSCGADASTLSKEM